MKESIGYTVSLNIAIVFITIIIAFLCAALIYFKSNKVSNVITNAIEKYEGYTSSAEKEIMLNLTSLGYARNPINCDATVTDSGACEDKCVLLTTGNADGDNGYCVYECSEKVSLVSTTCANDTDYIYYKIRTNMMINIPIINDVLNVPIYSNTNRLYNKF